MKKSTKIIICLLVVFVLGLIGYAVGSGMKKSAEMGQYSEWDIIEGNELNGNIGDHLVGNKDAKVKIIEYADFQCSACASTYPYIHDVVEEYGDQVAYTFRTYILSYHPNGNAAATAATAAGLQGYFDDYAKILFANQNSWYDLTGTARDDAFRGYLEEASDGKADLEKYKTDLKSEAIKNKISFDRALALRVKLTATPTIYINKEKFEIETVKEADFKKQFKAKIEEALKNAG